MRVSTFELLERREVLSTFMLHSNPGADHTIYLDFDGHVTTGTNWNSPSFGDPIITPPFDQDGDESTFSAGELAAIEEVFARVAEDFIPFDVNVTTQEPGIENLSNDGTPGDRYGIRVAIGGCACDWFGQGAGGTALPNSFTNSVDNPAFVFSENLANLPKYIANAASHEVGHTLRLGHDGTSSSSYYQGHGSGATGWFPIMGTGTRELSQWSKGEYPDANQLQDDLAIITTQNGFGYRADDWGDSIANADPLADRGIIETSADVDVFELVSNGTINLTIETISLGANLDILAELYDASGGLIISGNPVNQLDVQIVASVSPGTYYLAISGTGKPANGSDYGYSDYGSLGQYFISGTPTPSVIPPEVPQIAWAIADAAVLEGGNNAVTPLVFTITRTGDADYAASIEWTMVLDGAADAGDFVEVASGTLHFAAGQTSATITVLIDGDKKKEADETFSVVLTNASLGSFSDDTATGTILNDDGGGGGGPRSIKRRAR